MTRKSKKSSETELGSRNERKLRKTRYDLFNSKISNQSEN